MKRLLLLFSALALTLLSSACGTVEEEPRGEEPAPVDMAAATTASVTDEAYRVRIEIRLPGDWDWEVPPVEESDPPPCEGLLFYPKDNPDVRIRLLWYADNFGMCGTGVDFSELTLREDLTATLGVERCTDVPCGDSGIEPVHYGMFTVCFRDVPGSYAAQFELTEAQEAEYYDEIISILSTAQLGEEGDMRESKAIELVQAEYAKIPDLPKPDTVVAHYSWEDNRWTVNYLFTGSSTFYSYGVDVYGNVFPHTGSSPMQQAQ